MNKETQSTAQEEAYQEIGIWIRHWYENNDPDDTIKMLYDFSAHQFKQSPSDAQIIKVKELCKNIGRICTPSEYVTGFEKRFDSFWEINEDMIKDKLLSTHKEEPQGMKWVRADKRLPNIQEGQGVYLKGYKRLMYGVIYKEWVAPQNEYFIQIGTDKGEVLSSLRNGHEELKYIFWLDESESSDAGQSSNVKEESK
jgi:hypothetical protein